MKYKKVSIILSIRVLTLWLLELLTIIKFPNIFYKYTKVILNAEMTKHW